LSRVFELIRPKQGACGSVKQLGADLNVISCAPNTPFEHEADAEVLADLTHIDAGLTLVGECRMSGDHEAAVDARQVGRQVICDPVGKILLVRVPL
jgi:hypothetical protein